MNFSNITGINPMYIYRALDMHVALSELLSFMVQYEGMMDYHDTLCTNLAETRSAVVEVGHPWSNVTVKRKLPPLKYYYNFEMSKHCMSG